MKVFEHNFQGLLKAVMLGVVLLTVFASDLEAAEVKPIDDKNSKPSLFDVKANDISVKSLPVIKPWKRIDIDPEYAGGWVVAGDVDGDGQVEIVSARNVNKKDNHYTCSVVVHRLDGTVLWRWGNPGTGRNKLHHDVACQIYDWDEDGRNEIVVAAKESVVVLNGATGKEKHRFSIPPNASDCIVFVNLSGGTRPADILVKTRYGQIWAYDYKGKQLWTVKKPGGYRTAHQPLPIDIDHDGIDEIMAGYAMLNADGSVRWSLQDTGLSLGRGHLDCARLFKDGKTPEESRIVVTLCGDNGIAMVDGNGKLLWARKGLHYESIRIGRVCPDIPGSQLIVDICHTSWGESPTCVLAEDGTWLGRIISDRSRRHQTIDWDSSGIDSFIISQTCAIFDGAGKKTAVFDLPWNGKKIIIQSYKGDMTGNGIPDLLFHTVPAKEVYISVINSGNNNAVGIKSGSGLDS